METSAPVPATGSKEDVEKQLNEMMGKLKLAREQKAFWQSREIEYAAEEERLRMKLGQM